MTNIQPLYFVTHPDGSYSVADPQPVLMPQLPAEALPQLCAPISLEWMARQTGHREGYNAALARVREVNPGVQFGTFVAENCARVGGSA